MSGLARSSHRALNFQCDLTRMITLTDGRQAKLHDARTALLDVSVNAQSGAPETGKRDDVAAATELTERVLRGRGLMA